MAIEGLQIGLLGGMRAGKDEVGEYLVKKYGFKRFAFADGVKKTAKKLFPAEFEKGKPRKLLQDFGQYCVSLDQDVWVNYMFREMLFQEVDPVTDNVVVTDVRQPHEYEKLLESGFTFFLIDTPEPIRRKRAGDIPDAQFYHETEQFFKTVEVDYVIQNDQEDDLRSLYRQIDYLIMDMTGGEVHGSRGV